jgi:hypothetical protein
MGSLKSGNGGAPSCGMRLKAPDRTTNNEMNPMIIYGCFTINFAYLREKNNV